MNAKTNPLLDIQAKVLQVTYNHNMSVLQKEMPDIYKYYKNYTPKNTQLIFDDNGHVNLINNGELVYQGNPLLESNKQVEKFIKAPLHYNYKLSRDGQFNFEHEHVLEAIVKQRVLEVGKGEEFNLVNNDQIDFIAIMGSGLGYHLESLFSRFAIRSALVYEPNPDCFYATLHNIDIKKLIEGCRSHGGHLTLKIGGSSEGFVNQIGSIFAQQGYFNIARMCIYRHYLSDKTNDALKMVSDLAHRYVNTWGFGEDEIISLSHTLSNIATYKFPSMLSTAKQKKRNQPVFIIGNGPSLDMSYEYLKQNRSNAVFISCGTALKPLLENGLVPDIHVEMERTAILFKWIDKVGHKDKLKKIDLICLNTVYPEILKLFKQAHLILKPNDLGTVIIKEYISEKYAEIFNCNPTVTNAATASAIAMGFKNLTLFGVDYGFKSDDHHHSKDSAYYTEQKSLNIKKITGTMSVEANFGGSVYTTAIFDHSRSVLELLLQDNPDVNCVNTSDGAKVKRSTSCQIADLPLLDILANRNDFVASFLHKSFDNKGYSHKDIGTEFEIVLSKFEIFIKQIIAYTKNVITRLDLIEAFSHQFKYVANTDNQHAKESFYRFINGTLNYFQTYIMSNVFLYSDKKQQADYIQFCLKKMNAHIEWLYQELCEYYNKPSKN